MTNCFKKDEIEVLKKLLSSKPELAEKVESMDCDKYYPVIVLSREDISAVSEKNPEDISDDEMKWLARKMEDPSMAGYWDSLRYFVNEL